MLEEHALSPRIALEGLILHQFLKAMFAVRVRLLLPPVTQVRVPIVVRKTSTAQGAFVL